MWTDSCVARIGKFLNSINTKCFWHESWRSRRRSGVRHRATWAPRFPILRPFSTRNERHVFIRSAPMISIYSDGGPKFDCRSWWISNPPTTTKTQSILAATLLSWLLRVSFFSLVEEIEEPSNESTYEVGRRSFFLVQTVAQHTTKLTIFSRNYHICRLNLSTNLLKVK